MSVHEKSLHRGIGKNNQYRVRKESSAQAVFCQRSDVISTEMNLQEGGNCKKNKKNKIETDKV